MNHNAWLIFIFLVEIGFHHVGQAELKLLTSGDPPSSTSQSAGITGLGHCTWPREGFFAVGGKGVVRYRNSLSGLMSWLCELAS